MPRHQRRCSNALWGAALATLFASPGIAQDGTRPYRPPVREAYQPRIAGTEASAVSQGKAPARVAILGTVVQPGTYICPPGSDVGKLLAAVGGVTPEASGVWTLIRGGRPQGTVPFDVAQPDFSQFGELRDGDVAVFHAQRGVRNAHYQWTLADQRASGPHSSVQNAAREQFASIACLGLAPHPVVLSVPLQQANETSVLIGLLEMNPAAVGAAVRPLLKTTSHESEALPDGTVLAFDRSVLKPTDITSKLAFPPPSPLPQVPDPVGDAPADAPAVLPQATDAAAPDAANEEVQPLPMPVSQRVVTPAGDHQIVPNGHLLTQPLPNLTFAYDRVWNTAVDVNAEAQSATADETASRPWRSAPVVRGPQQDADAKNAPAESTTIPASLLTSSLGKTGEGPSTAFTPPAAIAPQADATDAASLGIAAVPPGRSSQIGTIIGIIVASTLCLLAGGLAIREFRKRRSRIHPEVQAPQGSNTSPQAVPLTILQELLENRLPVIEEPATQNRPLQLHGDVVGQRRLRVDAAHREVPPPHFMSVTTATEKRRQERLQKHLAAATAATKQKSSTVSPAPTADVRESASGTQAGRSVRYDIVQPEPQVSDASRSVRRPHAPDRASGAHGDLLTRVLSSLREET